MKRLYFDLETDGLLEEVSVIHSLVIKDLDTGVVMSCTDWGDPSRYHCLKAGLDYLATADVLYGHNIISYDLPVLKKLYPTWTTKAAIRDTFIIASMRFAHIKDTDFADKYFPRQLAGRHSLKAWGYRLRKLKTEYPQWCAENGITEPWKEWRPEMQSYCEDDVDTGEALVIHIAKNGVSMAAVETETKLRQYLDKQEANGWPFDMEGAAQLQAILSARREELFAQLKAEFKSWDISLGMFTPKVNNKARGYVKGVEIERFKTVEFNPGSRPHIANRLTALYGWKPEVFTPGGEPQVNEDTMASLDYPPMKLILEFLLVEKRLGQLSEGKEGWLRHAKTNAQTGLSHIHGRVINSGAITHRASHVNPNLGQVPKVGSKYGADCRRLFRVPKGWKQLGSDASGLEARGLGHYVAKYDGGAYATLLLQGDIHTANQLALGLPAGKETVDEDGKKYRDRAKTWFYAWLYGAGDEKLGKILSPKTPKQWAAMGKKAKVLFLKANPALARLIADVKTQVKSRDNPNAPGWIKSVDGRRVYIRSEHSALNTLIQCAGAIICKTWIVNFNDRLVARFGEQGWDGQWAALGWIHDEVQLAVKPEIAEEVGAILIEEMEKLTQQFAFRCPLTGEAKIGDNWKDTH